VVRSRALDIDCFVGDVDSAVEAVIRRARSREGGRACFANVHVLVTSQRNEELRTALQSSWVVFPDGSPIAWLQRRLGCASAQRVAGPDLMPAVFDRGRKTGLRHFLFGSTRPVVDAVQARLSSRFPGINIVGTAAPEAGEEHSAELLDRIRTTDPHLIWVALGAPKQELWTQQHSNLFGSSLLLSVGAAFDFIAETKPRAPEWMQQHGLEWLHRFATEPRRLGWRYLSTNSIFLISALRELSYR
jgi:N-acetylglucosaminyldiphosphoundecaprenol N-acetyl-beta-D-mannosaminyltransferase